MTEIDDGFLSLVNQALQQKKKYKYYFLPGSGTLVALDVIHTIFIIFSAIQLPIWVLIIINLSNLFSGGIQD